MPSLAWTCGVPYSHLDLSDSSSSSGPPGRWPLSIAFSLLASPNSWAAELASHTPATSLNAKLATGEPMGEANRYATPSSMAGLRASTLSKCSRLVIPPAHPSHHQAWPKLMPSSWLLREHKVLLVDAKALSSNSAAFQRATCRICCGTVEISF